MGLHFLVNMFARLQVWRVARLFSFVEGVGEVDDGAGPPGEEGGVSSTGLESLVERMDNVLSVRLDEDDPPDIWSEEVITAGRQNR